jgi:molybdopterin biosynthesis enzyme
VKNELVACVLTGQEAGADGICVEHGEAVCVVTVAVAPPVFDCVIPGYQCTHDHSGDAQRS